MLAPPLEAGASTAARRWPRRLRYGAGVAVAAVVLSLAVSAAGGPSRAVQALARTQPGWLVAALLAQALSFELMGLRLRRLVPGSARLTHSAATSLELAMNGLWTLAPAAPAEAMAYGAVQLRRRGLDRTRVGVVLAVEQVLTFGVVYLVAAANLLLVVARRDFPVPGPWPPLAAVAVLLLLAWTAVLARRPASMHQLSRLGSRLHFWAPSPSDEELRRRGAALHATTMDVLGPPGKALSLTVVSLLSHLAAVLSLMFSLRAVGLVVDIDLVLLATAVALIVSSVPLLPAGLGTVEVAVPALLHWYGAPLGQALAGAVVARVVGTLLPAFAGLVALVALRVPEPEPVRVPEQRTG